MSIDPQWMKDYQKKQENLKIAIDDWVACLELESLFEEEES